MKKRLLIYSVFILIVCLSIVFFWIFRGALGAMGYSILFIILLNPITMFIGNLVIGMDQTRKRIDYLVPLAYGMVYMALGYLTFSLLNNITFDKLNPPDLYSFLIGSLVAYGGLFLGYSVNLVKKRRIRS